MFLKSIEIFGFKSFADKTLIKFEPGITTIVGPNGSGKSNVVDAIKWVLGEKQAKNIRGKTMEDIIFSGTDQRKPLSLSEVSIIIDNSNKILDIDSDSITIGRRIFRDGESEYLLNKSPVRLKDIEKLFMDTGIGKTSYSVMEQGKMDMILSTRAEDRRYIFEEAAGISRYKLQKKESLTKLQNTGDNLERINDIIKEIEREKDLKAKQAEVTKVYLLLMSESVDLDMQLNAIKYREIAAKQEKVQEDINKQKFKRENISAMLSSTMAKNEKDEKKKNDVQHQLFELEKRLHAYKIRLEDIDIKNEKNRNQIDENKSHIENIKKEIEDRSNNLDRLTNEKVSTTQAGVEIREMIKNDKDKLAVFLQSRERKVKSINKSREKISENRITIKEKERILHELRGALEVAIKRLIDAIEERKTELLKTEPERQEVREKIDESLGNIEKSVQKALQNLEAGMVNDALKHLKDIDIKYLKEDIQKFESYEDGFRSLLFDKKGIHAEKEELDKRIKHEVGSIEDLRVDISSLDEYILNEQIEIENINEMLTRIEKDLSKNDNEKEWIEKHLQSLDYQIKDVSKQIDSYKEDIVRTERMIENLKSEINEWEDKLIEFNEESKSLTKNISVLINKRGEIEDRVDKRKKAIGKEQEELDKILEKIGSFEKSHTEVLLRKNIIEDYFWNEYEKKISDIKKLRVDESKYSSIQAEIQDIKNKIQELGPINNLAIEEYKDLKKRFEFYINQKNDIEKAHEDILSVIESINNTSVEMFIDTFKDIQKNFSDIFKRLFSGGDAVIELIDMENILESGIDIRVRPPGKKVKNINLLSGGERALTAVALLFAVYMVKPSPFCFLDEIDSSLDEENIGRFVKMLKEFARGTQFVIVTHNKKTIIISESIYGVTMEEPGISKVMSFQMKKVETG